MKYVAKINDQEFSLELWEQIGGMEARVNGEKIPVHLEALEGNSTLSALIANRSLEVDIARNEAGYVIYHRGSAYECVVETAATAEIKRNMTRASREITQKEVRSPMPGLIVSLAVSEGQKVKAGDALLIIEAMKMENEIRAPFAATVRSIKVKEGDTIEVNQLLMVFD